MAEITKHSLFNSVAGDVFNLFNGPEVNGPRVVEFLKYGNADVATAANVSLQSVRYDERMPNNLRERLLEWATAINLVGRFFENDLAKTVMWFHTPNPLLGNLSPRELIRMGRSAKLLKFIQIALSENGE